MGVTHQQGNYYWAKKVLDLGAVPEDLWNAATEVRLSAWFCVFFAHDLKQAHGSDATIEILVNGTLYPIPDRSRLPQHILGKSMTTEMRWHDFVLPKKEFVRGINEIVFRLRVLEGKTTDDHLYLGIDNSVPTRNSWVKLNAKEPWRQDRLNALGAAGEYMVRLYLLRGGRDFSACWKPAAATADDPFQMFDYAGTLDGQPRLEWNALRLDPGQPLRVTVETADGRAFELQWLTAENERQGAAVKAKGPHFETRLSLSPTLLPSGIQFSRGLPVTSVKVEGGRAFRPLSPPIDMVPRLEKPAGGVVDRPPACHIDAEKIQLCNENLRCEFRQRNGRLRLASLYNEMAGAEMIRTPDDCALALVEVSGKRYAASRDFVCRSVTPLPQQPGFTAVLDGDAARLELRLSVWIDAALHWGLKVTNRAAVPVDFKAAFPHLSGLAISAEPAEEYFFYPLGCVVSHAPALIRKGYGDYQSLYQIMDVFSPKRGAGLAAWCTDSDGRYKVLALRNCVPGKSEIAANHPICDTPEEFQWTNSLDVVPGVGLTWEYLRRTRGPGQLFAPPDVALQAHAGDWHVAMRQYAQWCHTIWKYRPYPSRLTPIINTVAPGLGKDTIFHDGKYQTDFLRPRTDGVEL
jgi:hypothetical protein